MPSSLVVICPGRLLVCGSVLSRVSCGEGGVGHRRNCAHLAVSRENALLVAKMKLMKRNTVRSITIEQT